MSSDKSFIDYIVEQIENAGAITCRSMFGEYAIYCDCKVVALVCDNQLFVKPTDGGRLFIGDDTVEVPAYSGAKPSFLIENFEDREWISDLIRITAKELPIPVPKKRKSKGNISNK